MTKLVRYPLLMIFICNSLVLSAQGSAAPGKTEPNAAPELSFRIRSAFSLTPDMVRALQTKSPESVASPNSASPDGAARTAAPAREGYPEISWSETLARSLPFSAPLDVRLVGKNVVALVQIVPIALRAAIIDLMVQGMVWVKMPDDSLSFKTTIQSLSLPLGARLFYYPLGLDTRDGAPIVVEIRVDKRSNP
jgi:hypothetical protein